MAFRVFARSAPGGAADYRPSLRRRSLGRLATVSLATVGAVALVLATPAAAFATGTVVDPLPTPQVFTHTNLKSCDQIAPSGDVALLTSGGQPVSASNADGSGTLNGADNQFLDVEILAGHSVTAIIVKGGDNSNVYFFNPPVAGDALFQHLNAPTNGGNNPDPAISHWLVCGLTDDGPVPPPASAVLTSEVHLAVTHAVIDSTENEATEPADVHDSVTLTVSGKSTWSGKVTVFFFKSLNCGDGNVDNAVDQTPPAGIAVSQSTQMPLDDLLPQTALATGDYSYIEFFISGTEGLADVQGPCEPFKVKDPVSSTQTPAPCAPLAAATVPCTTTSLPTTGAAVGGYVLTGGALVAVGGALIAFVFLGRRRRTATENSGQ